MLKPFKSVSFDLTASDIQKFAAACLLAALLPVQGHAASALSKQPGPIGQGVPQAESAAQDNSKQDMSDRQSAGAAKPNALGSGKIKQNMMMDQVKAGAANPNALGKTKQNMMDQLKAGAESQNTAAKSTLQRPKSDNMQTTSGAMQGSQSTVKDAGQQAKGVGAEAAARSAGDSAMQQLKGNAGRTLTPNPATQQMGTAKSNDMASQARAANNKINAPSSMGQALNPKFPSSAPQMQQMQQESKSR